MTFFAFLQYGKSIESIVLRTLTEITQFWTHNKLGEKQGWISFFLMIPKTQSQKTQLKCSRSKSCKRTNWDSSRVLQVLHFVLFLFNLMAPLILYKLLIIFIAYSSHLKEQVKCCTFFYTQFFWLLKMFLSLSTPLSFKYRRWTNILEVKWISQILRKKL